MLLPTMKLNHLLEFQDDLDLHVDILLFLLTYIIKGQLDLQSIRISLELELYGQTNCSMGWVGNWDSGLSNTLLGRRYLSYEI